MYATPFPVAIAGSQHQYGKELWILCQRNGQNNHDDQVPVIYNTVAPPIPCARSASRERWAKLGPETYGFSRFRHTAGC
jgi:hypothetical protein